MDDHPEDDAGQEPGRGEEDAGEDVPPGGYAWGFARQERELPAAE